MVIMRCAQNRSRGELPLHDTCSCTHKRGKREPCAVFPGPLGKERADWLLCMGMARRRQAWPCQVKCLAMEPRLSVGQATLALRQRVSVERGGSAPQPDSPERVQLPGPSSSARAASTRGTRCCLLHGLTGMSTGCYRTYRWRQLLAALTTPYKPAG